MSKRYLHIGKSEKDKVAYSKFYKEASQDDTYEEPDVLRTDKSLSQKLQDKAEPPEGKQAIRITGRTRIENWLKNNLNSIIFGFFLVVLITLITIYIPQVKINSNEIIGLEKRIEYLDKNINEEFDEIKEDIDELEISDKDLIKINNKIDNLEIIIQKELEFLKERITGESVNNFV